MMGILFLLLLLLLSQNAFVSMIEDHEKNELVVDAVANNKNDNHAVVETTNWYEMDNN